MPRRSQVQGGSSSIVHSRTPGKGCIQGEVALLEEPGETLHPLSYVGGRQRRLRLVGKEAANQPGEPGVVLGITHQRDQLPQRRRTPQEQPRQPAQERRGRSFHRIASKSRLVAAA